jgi:hypothetical protein
MKINNALFALMKLEKKSYQDPIFDVIPISALTVFGHHYQCQLLTWTTLQSYYEEDQLTEYWLRLGKAIDKKLDIQTAKNNIN